MCDKLNYEILTLPDGKQILVDGCLLEALKIINNMRDFTTLGCCCGHGVYKKSIIIQNKIDNRIFEYYNQVEINRKNRFYKMDKNGYYFLPELELNG